MIKAITTYVKSLELVPTDPSLVAHAEAINSKLNAPDVIGGVNNDTVNYGQAIEDMAYRKLEVFGINDVKVIIVTKEEYVSMGYDPSKSVAVFDPNPANKRIVINTDSGIYHGDNFEELNSVINHEINHAIENQIIDRYNEAMKAATTAAEKTAVFNSFNKAERLIIGDNFSITNRDVNNKISADTRGFLGIGERTSNIAGQAR